MSNTSDTSSVLETARRAAADAGLDPASLAHDVSARLREAAEAQKNAGAEKVMGMARAIRSAAGNMEEDSPEMARYVRSAASTLEGITQDINERSVDEMTQALVDVARRSPALFFAGSVMAGFALFRFLNAAQTNGGSSSNRGSRSAGRQLGAGQGGYGSSDAGGYDVGSSTGSGGSPGSGSSASGASSTAGGASSGAAAGSSGSVAGSGSRTAASGTSETRGAS